MFAYFIDIIVTGTQKQTAELALACTEASIKKFLAEVHECCPWEIYLLADGARTYNCGVFAAGLPLVHPSIKEFIRNEAGDGKSATDVHFSFAARKVQSYVDAKNNILSPHQLCAALNGQRR